MKKMSILIQIASTAVLIAALPFACAAQSATIYMSENASPLVSPEIVDQYGALKVGQWIGVAYVVGTPNADWSTSDLISADELGSLAAAKHKPKPIPGWPLPRGLRCVCPESFVANLAERADILVSEASQ